MTRNLVPRGVFWSAMSDIETESEEELIEQAYHFKTTGKYPERCTANKKRDA